MGQRPWSVGKAPNQWCTCSLQVVNSFFAGGSWCFAAPQQTPLVPFSAFPREFFDEYPQSHQHTLCLQLSHRYIYYIYIYMFFSPDSEAIGVITSSIGWVGSVRFGTGACALWLACWCRCRWLRDVYGSVGVGPWQRLCLCRSKKGKRLAATIFFVCYLRSMLAYFFDAYIYKCVYVYIYKHMYVFFFLSFFNLIKNSLSLFFIDMSYMYRIVQ